MHMTFGEYRASDQNTLHYQPPLERSAPAFARWPFWKLAANFLALAAVMLLICVGLPVAWGG